MGWPGAPGLNTFYFAPHGLVSSTEAVLDDAQLAHDRVHAAFVAGQDIYPSPWIATVSPTVDVLEPSNGELVNSFSVDPSAAVGSTNGADFGPTPAMILLQLRTATFVDGSRIAGRAFLGPCVPTADPNGSPAASILEKAVDFSDALQDAGVTEEPVLVVWRRPRLADAEHLPEPVTARDGSIAKVTSITVPDKYAVLRSRRD